MSEQVQTQVKTELKLAPMYRVVMHNDDKTPMDFVIQVLIEVFEYDASSAWEITMEIHHGTGKTVGVYTHEVAEHKKSQCDQAATRFGYPFKVTVEEDK